MALEIGMTDLFSKWLSFSENKSIQEIEFFNPETSKVEDLLGEFATERLVVFGEHASASVIAFYSETPDTGADDTPIAWLDSEGSPFIVISKNLREFLSILPYGPGLIYSVAALIDNNFEDQNLFSLVRTEINNTPDSLLNESRNRFSGIDILLDWLRENNIPVSQQPAEDILNAHIANRGLRPWIYDKLNI